jgi:hypothetical protein
MNRETHKGVVLQDGALVLLHFEASGLDSVSEPGYELRQKEVSRIFKEIQREADPDMMDVD